MRRSDDENTDLLEIMSVVMPEVGRLARAMISDSVASNEQRKQAIEDLCLHVSRDCTTLYRPGENPVNDACPVRGYGKNDKVRISTHIYKCRQEEVARTLQQSEAAELRYCFTCFDWFVEEEWDQHCQIHLQSLTFNRYGSITYCHTLFRPTFYSFCLGNSRPAVPALSRWSSRTRVEKIRDHLQQHHGSCSWPRKCRHPLCYLSLTDVFLYHLSDVHSLQMESSTNLERQPCNPDSFLLYNSI